MTRALELTNDLILSNFYSLNDFSMDYGIQRFYTFPVALSLKRSLLYSEI